MLDILLVIRVIIRTTNNERVSATLDLDLTVTAVDATVTAVDATVTAVELTVTAVDLTVTVPRFNLVARVFILHFSRASRSDFFLF